jgi:hypothetical protein
MFMSAIVRISMVMVTAVAFVFPFSHCGSVQAAQGDRALTVIVVTKCEAMVAAYCRGGFGFRVAGDGAFLIGPNPNGRSVSGRLRLSEIRALRSAAVRVLAAIKGSVAECPISSELPGIGESVEVSKDGQTVVLRGDGGRLGRDCAPGDAIADAKLFGLADSLMRSYYPSPF